MVETDWREILSFSQRELTQSDKEKLCEALSWMEADDIELNFGDLKTLFRLAQDILKYKSEQVNNLLGQLETVQRKLGKGKSKATFVESPTKSSDDVLETIAHQEEVIKVNKEILEQLYADIAELEGKKNKLERDGNNLEKDSESSRDALSEMAAIAQMENEIALKNKHIRKLLGNVKVLEDENTKLKEKVSVLKDKLTEATEIIENLTEQLFSINNENSRLKEMLGKCEESKAKLSLDVESLRQDLLEKESTKENIYDEIKAKVQHWKNIAKAKKTELESILNENIKLKEDLEQASQLQQSSPAKTKRTDVHELKIKELQDKLSEASNEILKSVTVIENLKAENDRLKATAEETHDVISVSDNKNESDDGKERTLINKLKKKVKSLTIELKAAEEMIAVREKEFTEIASQLQLLRSDDGINALLEGLKSKKRKLKLQDEGIKSLVQEVNSLNKTVDDLQLENESMRQQLNIPADEKIPTTGILKRFQDLTQHNAIIIKESQILENKLVTSELHNRTLNSKLIKLTTKLRDLGLNENEICNICDDDSDDMPNDGGGEGSAITMQKVKKTSQISEEHVQQTQEMEVLAEENEGLRKGLQEILEFLKDNSKTTSGILALQCPSLEKVLNSMESRHAAGWFAPHMRTVMELKEALGGKDALLVALHEARKETFEVMDKLSKETERSQELEHKLHDISPIKTDAKIEESEEKVNWGEFGTWISEKEQVIQDFSETGNIEALFNRGNLLYENKLKKGLIYFNHKFKSLFEKMTALSIQIADDKNKWLIQEEQYKAEIEKLKAQLPHDDEDDRSDISPGIINLPTPGHLQRKCAYLEESYKYIRTLHEDMRNEFLDVKKEALISETEYEAVIQKLILSVVSLTDKLRYSISLDIFWKQNNVLNDVLTRHRNLLENRVNDKIESVNLLKQLEQNRAEIISAFSSNLLQNQKKNSKLEKAMSEIEQSTMSKQLKLLCSEIEGKNKQIKNLEQNIITLQRSQATLIDDTLSSSTKEEVNLMKEQLQKLVDENTILKEQCQHVESQLDIALLQLQDHQQEQMGHDMEVNMLRHQILDLQSVGDNKAIVARLSGEVLVAHLQVSESYKKIERLNLSLKKEKQSRIEAEEMLQAREKIFNVYALRFEAKFRYMYEVMQILRQQYQGSLPIASIENYLNNMEELTRKTHDVNEKLNEIEDLQYSLMTKHTICDQILEATKSKCMNDGDACPHKIQKIVLQRSHAREIDHYIKKLNTSEQSREEIMKRYNKLEKTLVLVNQAFEKPLETIIERKVPIVPTEKNGECNLELEDIHSDDESQSRRSQTITLPKPKILKRPDNKNGKSNKTVDDEPDDLIGSPIKTAVKRDMPEVVNVFVQTTAVESRYKHKLMQTDLDQENTHLKQCITSLEKHVEQKDKELIEAKNMLRIKTEENLITLSEKRHLESKIQNLSDSLHQRDEANDSLRDTVDDLRKQIGDLKETYDTERARIRHKSEGNNEVLMDALKQFEEDKTAIITEYQGLLVNEREMYASSVKQLQVKVMELQHQLESASLDTTTANAETIKEVSNKYTTKILELEEKCFKLQNELDGTKTELITYQSEVVRWKELAGERLTKMEHLNSQLEERHSHEVESYKAENDHWLCQLNESQKEHTELRTRLAEQKAAYMKQIADKDAHIEHLKSIIHGLKTQMMTMQTMISVNDPNFDLSAIVEVEEDSDAVSTQASGQEHLELKCFSSMDLHETADELRASVSSSALWQEPVIERLRREKQLTSKQNAMLRRQIKALAARERRARLDAQNLKNQVFRISTLGNKVPTVETASLRNKIASLQAQLMSARRDTNSTVAIWDKWKRSQQASERWQARYEEKCQEVKKLEGQLSLAKSSVARLEKEKKVLLQRLNEVKSEKALVLEKQDSERSEKRSARAHIQELDLQLLPPEPPVSARALLERVQAQQRRIAALEAADIGNEHLVSEYEKALAEIASLKGQVLKLESTLLEVQIKTPMKQNLNKEQEMELEHFKSYCEMLKEENVQLTMKVNALETQPASAHQQRINDLEQTVLTLRGLVSKLQSDNKSMTNLRRPDSRPSSVRSGPDKNKSQLESYRIEISNLKRSLQDKDLLLERSKEMLKIAAEREDELLRENLSLRRQLDEVTKRGYRFSSDERLK